MKRQCAEISSCNTLQNQREFVPQAIPEIKKPELLTELTKPEVLNFLAARPVHNVAMTSMIHDNGIDNSLNRGKFYGYRNDEGTLAAVALIGHTTLIE